MPVSLSISKITLYCASVNFSPGNHSHSIPINDEFGFFFFFYQFLGKTLCAYLDGFLITPACQVISSLRAN